MSSRYDCTDPAQREAGLRHARDALARGELVVLPTDTVHGIAADAFDAGAVARLLAAKGRDRAMPPPVLVSDARVLDGLAAGVPPQARALAEAFWPGGLTLVCRAQPSLRWDLGETGGTVAVRVPDHDLARELLRSTGPLAVSSANRTGRPAATTAAGAEEQLGSAVAAYLDDGQPARTDAPPSTIVDATGERLRVLRRGAVPTLALRMVAPVDDDEEPADAGASAAGEGPPGARRASRVRAYLLLLLIAAGTTYLATPLARRVAERTSAMTPVRDRDVHSVPTPRLGGLAMLAGVAVAFVAASRMPFLDDLFSDSRGPWAVLGAAAIVSLLGVADDVWGLDPFTKLAGQVLAAGLMAWQGVQLLSLPIFGGLLVASSELLLAVTVLAVVVAVNAVNFVDGLDGLAAGVVGIGSLAFFVYSYLLTRNASPDNYANLATMTVAVLLGVCLGFLPHNVHPARIFMGDSGSMLIGLLLAAAAVSVTGRLDPNVAQISGAQVVPVFLPVLLPVAVLLLPLTDLVLAVVRRVLAGQSPFAADKLHLHHRLLSLGHTHGRAVGVLWLWTAVVSFGAIALAFVPLHLALPGWAAAMALAVLVTLGPRRARARRHGPVLLRERRAADRAAEQAAERVTSQGRVPGGETPLPTAPAPASSSGRVTAVDVARAPGAAPRSRS